MIKLSKKLKLPADLYSRNTLFGILVNHLLEQRQSHEHQRSLEILDIGGYQGKLSWFMPQHTRITILDQKPAPEGHGTNYVQADARQIPFPDKSFDLVISSDLLEHLTSTDRAQVIQEMFRVSRRYVILAAPFANIFNQKAEEIINRQFEEYTGLAHPFLIEHLERGLPDLDETEELVSKLSHSYQKIGEGNIYNWYLQQLSQGIKQIIQEIHRQGSFNEFFNENLFELGNFRGPHYRTVLLCDQQQQLNRSQILDLIESHNNFHTTTYFEVYKKVFDEFRAVLISTRESFSDLAIDFSQLQEKFQQEIQFRDSRLKLMDSQLSEVQDIIQEKEQSLQEKSQLFEQAKQELALSLQHITNLENQQKNFELQKSRFVSEASLLSTQVRSQDLLLQRYKHELEKSHATEQELTNLIVIKEQALVEKNQEINQKNQQIGSVQASLAEYKKELETVLNSRSWKLVKLYGRLKNTLYIRPKHLLKTSWQVLRTFGLKEFLRRFKRKFFKVLHSRADQHTTLTEPPLLEYQKFVEQTALSPKDIKQMRDQIANFDYKPLISICVPVYNIDEIWLRKAVNSVFAQIYDKWELCLVDDASTDHRIHQVLQEYAAMDSRVKVQFRPQNGGIVKASNSALKLASGAYVGLLDNDDELAQNALFEVVLALQEKRYDLLYSDEDKLDMQGRRCDPFFKPDFNPDLFLSNNYICHFSVFRRKILEEIGGFREGTDGSQDYDLLLRFTDKPRQIKHLAKILYHWRKIPGSTADSIHAKPYVYEAAKKALRDTLKRRSIKATVEDGIWLGSYRIKREISGQPLVSIIIPFRDKVDILRTCLDSIFAKTTYQNYEILLVNNASEMLETREYMRDIENCPRVRLLHYNAPFNYSAINNFAMLRAQGEYLILLNNDTEVIEPEWIENLLEQAMRPEVGVVGAKLLYPTGQIQHAGVIVGIGGAANHAFAKKPGDDNGYFGQVNVIRNYSSVTAACLMVKKSVYEELDGLDEENLAVSFNDVDFCLRLREKGYLVVYTPFAVLYHHESLTRGYNVSFNEEHYLRRRHAGFYQKGDPYYNTNLTQERLDFSLRVNDLSK